MKDSEAHYRDLFENLPVSLWVQDFSAIKAYLDRLRHKGVSDLAQYLDDHPAAVDECIQKIKIIDLNQRTVQLYEAASKEEVVENMSRLFRDEMNDVFRRELIGIWNGQNEFTGEGVNYTLQGRRIDVMVRLSISPGYEDTLGRTLVSITDITERKQAQQQLAVNESHYRDLFENSPVSLWVEDFSAIRKRLDQLQAEGVTSLSDYLQSNPSLVNECMARIKVLDVNRRTLALFQAASKDQLLKNLPNIFRDEMRQIFHDELLDIWAGKVEFEREGINYTLGGDRLEVNIRWSVSPGYEQTLERTLISLTDITARKRAEEYLKYLGTHDKLTGLYNRAYFEEEKNRLERGRRFPISVIIADIDGLKPINDTLGHQAGDELLRRAAEVLRAGFRTEDVVARIGGDEFAIILPETDLASAEQTIERVRNLIALNNTFYQGAKLSFSLGVSCGESGCSLNQVQIEADNQMYADKRKRKAASAAPNETGRS